MKSMVPFFLISFLLNFALFSCTNSNSNTNQRDKKKHDIDSVKQDSIKVEQAENDSYQCDYLGFELPGDSAVLFAPGVVSTKEMDYAFEISPDGSKIMFSREASIYLINFDKAGKKWSKPEVAPFSDSKINAESCFSPDGKKVYFNSRRYCPGSKQANNIWVSQFVDGNWNKPYYSGISLNNKTVHAVSVAKNGNIYADGIVLFEFVEGKYQEPVKLPVKGGHVYIAPDESYILFGKTKDIYISFRKEDKSWSEAIKLPENINTRKREGNPFVSPDGKFLFFGRSYSIYWVSADFIEELSK